MLDIKQVLEEGEQVLWKYQRQEKPEFSKIIIPTLILGMIGAVVAGVALGANLQAPEGEEPSNLARGVAFVFFICLAGLVIVWSHRIRMTRQKGIFWVYAVTNQRILVGSYTLKHPVYWRWGVINETTLSDAKGEQSELSIGQVQQVKLEQRPGAQKGILDLFIISRSGEFALEAIPQGQAKGAEKVINGLLEK